MITLIAAIGENLEIGEKNKLLWDLPGDMQHFRETTKNATVVMGRKTFESIGRPLPKRRNIVLTRDKNFHQEGVEVFHNIDEVLEISDENIFIIGGAEIYTLFLEKADRMILTFVDAEFPKADAFFPKFEKKDWEIISEKFHEKDSENEFSFTILEFQKI